MKREEISLEEIISRYQTFYGKLSKGFDIYVEDLIDGKFASSTLAKKTGELLLIKLLPLERYEQLSNQPISADQKQRLLLNKKQISKISSDFSKEYIVDSINEYQNIFDLDWYDETNPNATRIANYFEFSDNELVKLLNNHIAHIEKFDQSSKDLLQIQKIVREKQISDNKIISEDHMEIFYNIFGKYDIYLSYQEIEALFNMKFHHSISEKEQNFISSAYDTYDQLTSEDVTSENIEEKMKLTQDLVKYSSEVLDHSANPELNVLAKGIIEMFNITTENNEQKTEPADNEDSDLALAIAMSLKENNPDENNNQVGLVARSDDYISES